MTATITRSESRTAKLGWVILLVMSALLIIQGINWSLDGPDRTLTNIAGRTSLTASEFQVGNPSAFDVITLVARNFAIYGAAFGLLALLVAWKGYRHGSRWAWMVMWVLVGAIAAVAVNFIMVGGVSAIGLSFAGLAAIALVGQLLAGKNVL